MLWTLLSIGVVLMHIAALMTPQWLLGPEEIILGGVPSPARRPINSSSTTTMYRNMETYTPTLGIFTRCKQIYAGREVLNEVQCAYYVHSFSDLPSGLWKATLVFYGMGLFVLCVIALASLLSLCVRSLCKKSLFTLSGLVQAVAGKNAIGISRYSDCLLF